MAAIDPATAANAAAVVISSAWGYANRHSAAGQERRGDAHLDAARALIEENMAVLGYDQDGTVVMDRIKYAREMKAELQKKSRLTRYLHSRQYRKMTKSVYASAKSITDRARDISTEAQLDRGQTVPVSGATRDLLLRYLICDELSVPGRSEDTGPAPSLARRPPLPLRSDRIDVNALPLTVIKRLIRMKVKTRQHVYCRYKFNTSQAEESMHRNVTLTRRLLADSAFLFHEDGRRYGSPIIQDVIATTWFSSTKDDGITHPTLFHPIPIPVIALAVTMIEECIREWWDGACNDSQDITSEFGDSFLSHVDTLQKFEEECSKNREMSVMFHSLRYDIFAFGRVHAGLANQASAASTPPRETQLEAVPEDADELTTDQC